MSFLWPPLCINCAPCVIAVLNCSPHLVAHLMLLAVHLSSIKTTWLTLLLVATQPGSSSKGNPSASDTFSSTHLSSHDVSITKRIGDPSEHCGTPACAGYLSLALPSIIISTILSDRILSDHNIRSPSICRALVKLTNLPFAMVGKAALMCKRRTPVMWPFAQAA